MTTQPDHGAREPGRARVVDARLHLLSRQVLDVDGEPVTTVDDLELVGADGGEAVPGEEVQVGSVLGGALLLTRLFGGRPPASRRPRIAWEHVGHLGRLVPVGGRHREHERRILRDFLGDLGRCGHVAARVELDDLDGDAPILEPALQHHVEREERRRDEIDVVGDRQVLQEGDLHGRLVPAGGGGAGGARRENHGEGTHERGPGSEGHRGSGR